MGCGAGMYVEGGGVTRFGIMALTFLRRFEDKNDHLVRRRISFVLGEGAEIAAVVGALTELGAVVAELEYERRLDDEKKRIVASFDVRYADTIDLRILIQAVGRLAGVRRVRVQGASSRSDCCRSDCWLRAAGAHRQRIAA